MPVQALFASQLFPCEFELRLCGLIDTDCLREVGAVDDRQYLTFDYLLAELHGDAHGKAVGQGEDAYGAADVRGDDSGSGKVVRHLDGLCLSQLEVFCRGRIH